MHPAQGLILEDNSVEEMDDREAVFVEQFLTGGISLQDLQEIMVRACVCAFVRLCVRALFLCCVSPGCYFYGACVRHARVPACVRAPCACDGCVHLRACASAPACVRACLCV